MADQFYMTRFVASEDDGERLLLFQQGSRNDEYAERNAKQFCKHAARIIETIETDPEKFQRAYEENERRYPGRPSTHELTGGMPNRLLRHPHLADRE